MLEGFRTLKISQIGACLADPIKNTADHNIGGTPCIWNVILLRKFRHDMTGKVMATCTPNIKAD